MMTLSQKGLNAAARTMFGIRHNPAQWRAVSADIRSQWRSEAESVVNAYFDWLARESNQFRIETARAIVPEGCLVTFRWPEGRKQ